MSSGYRRWCGQSALAAVLAVLCVLVANRLARRHLDLRADLSEDGLHTTSPVARRLFDELEDVLQVRAYFTGEVELGPVQIAKRRLVDQLQELERIAGGRLEVLFADPNTSSEARAEALAQGIQPVPLQSLQGTTEVTQDVYLGFVLRYAGREATIPFCLPQVFEYAFLSEVHRLLQDELPVVGFLVGDGEGTGDDGFGEARELLRDRYRVVEVLDLERGEPVPDTLDVLVVVRPVDLHARAAFEVDQHLQRGGSVLLLDEGWEVDPTAGTTTPLTSGLEPVLAAFGVRVQDGLACDHLKFNPITTRAPGSGRPVRLQYPFWIAVDAAGMERSLPVTGRLPGADLFWASPLALDPAPGGEPGLVLVRTSDTAFVVDPAQALELDPRLLAARVAERLASGQPASLPLAVLVSGPRSTAFPDGAPAPFDPYAATLGRPPAPETEPPEVRSDTEAGRLVVVGDADWVRDGSFFTARNRMLLANLVDWLALADDLVSLRSRMPRERRIRDLLEEARGERGLQAVGAGDDAVLERELVRFEADARRAAARARWLRMTAATGGSLGSALVLGLVLRHLLRSRWGGSA